MATDATDQLGRDLAVSGPVSSSPWAAQDVYSRLESMPPLSALKSLTKLGNDLLQRTAELPDTEQGLLSVLVEYRYAVFTFVAVATRMSVPTSIAAAVREEESSRLRTSGSER